MELDAPASLVLAKRADQVPWLHPFFPFLMTSFDDSQTVYFHFYVTYAGRKEKCVSLMAWIVGPTAMSDE